MAFQCSVCNEIHNDLPDMGFRLPDPYFGVPEAERWKRVFCNSDHCVIDGQHFFIRGIIEIPVIDYERRFGIGAWVSLKKENFEAYAQAEDDVHLGPYFGWLCNRIPYYDEDTRLLKTMVHCLGGGLRPAIELEPTNHPLALDQIGGITLARAWEMVHYGQMRH